MLSIIDDPVRDTADAQLQSIWDWYNSTTPARLQSRRHTVAIDVKLPIDVVPDSDPPIFRWRQAVDGYGGERVMVDYEQTLPANVEKAVQRLVGVAKQLLMENMALQGRALAAERTEDAALAKADGVPAQRAGEPRQPPKSVPPTKRGK